MTVKLHKVTFSGVEHASDVVSQLVSRSLGVAGAGLGGLVGGAQQLTATLGQVGQRAGQLCSLVGHR